ncbi:MAG: GNAT family N-acetyltransferase [Armatimonadota bacterium]|nr:GNAT family N-acetyltransferase [Armatimonadota bacterium]MCX7777565.1 GNAT family N-acetyltransferase [Armatimonadota bacterium]MDW8025574.1 GNAT family N-acetyltransferase [Armatimonadota bacterium]
MGVESIEHVEPFDGPRTPTPEEAESIIRVLYTVFFEPHGAPEYVAGACRWPMALRPGAREETFAMFYEGRAVSVIQRLERDFIVHGCKLRLGYVGSVSTLPEFRNRGLASTILAATMQRFRENGVDFVCISGDRPMYRRVGARPTGGLLRFTALRDEMVNAISNVPPVSLRRASIEDASLLSRLYEQEALRFVRPISDYEVVLRYEHCAGQRCEFQLVEQDGEPIGYLLMTSLQERNGRKWVRVFEFAGDRFLLLGALRELALGLPNDAEVWIDVWRGDNLSRMLSNLNLNCSDVRRSGTYVVIDFVSTMRKLLPYFESHLSPEFVRGIELNAGRERYVSWGRGGWMQITGETNLVWTMLGQPPGETITGVRASGLGERLFKECLPIPLPPVEMNMI